MVLLLGFRVARFLLLGWKDPIEGSYKRILVYQKPRSARSCKVSADPLETTYYKSHQDTLLKSPLNPKPYINP